mgnify:CR=1 FL=1
MSVTSEERTSDYKLPSNTTLQHVSKLAIIEDKPIMLDYWAGSCDKDVLIGVREPGENLIVKSEDEYTSTIVKFYKCGEEFLVITENSIYIVANDIPTRRISS